MYCPTEPRYTYTSYTYIFLLFFSDTQTINTDFFFKIIVTNKYIIFFTRLFVAVHNYMVTYLFMNRVWKSYYNKLFNISLVPRKMFRGKYLFLGKKTPRFSILRNEISRQRVDENNNFGCIIH